MSSGSLTVRFVYNSKLEVLCLYYMYGASEHTWSVTSVACTLYDVVPCLTSIAWVSLVPRPHSAFRHLQFVRRESLGTRLQLGTTSRVVTWQVPHPLMQLLFLNSVHLQVLTVNEVLR